MSTVQAPIVRKKMQKTNGQKLTLSMNIYTLFNIYTVFLTGNIESNWNSKFTALFAQKLVGLKFFDPLFFKKVGNKS